MGLFNSKSCESENPRFCRLTRGNCTKAHCSKRAVWVDEYHPSGKHQNGMFPALFSECRRRCWSPLTGNPCADGLCFHVTVLLSTTTICAYVSVSMFHLCYVLRNHTTSCISPLSVHGRIEERVERETEIYLQNYSYDAHLPHIARSNGPINIKITLILVYSRESVTTIKPSSCAQIGGSGQWRNSRSTGSALTEHVEVDSSEE